MSQLTQKSQLYKDPIHSRKGYEPFALFFFLGNVLNANLVGASCRNELLIFLVYSHLLKYQNVKLLKDQKLLHTGCQSGGQLVIQVHTN